MNIICPFRVDVSVYGTYIYIYYIRFVSETYVKHIHT